MERSEALCSEKEQRLHWHPAFYAGMQIELQDEADKLTFEEEYSISGSNGNHCKCKQRKFRRGKTYV